MSIISEINKLIDAGFTKNDIMRFYNSKISTNNEPESPKEEPKIEPEPKDNPEPQVDSLTSQISELIKVIQQSNIIKDGQPEPRTIDDIFESMFKDEEDK